MDPSRIAELLDPFLGPQDQRPNAQDLIGSISTYIDILQRWNARVNLTAIRNQEEIVTRHFGESFFTARHLFPAREHVGTGPGLPDYPGLAERGRGALGRPTKRSSPANQAVTAGNASECSNVSDNRGRVAFPGHVDPAKGEGALAPYASEDRRPDTDDRVTVVDIGSGAGFPGLPIKLWAPAIRLTLVESNHKKAAFLREITRALTLMDINIQNARAETLTSVSFDVVTLRAVERFEAMLPTAAALVRPGGRLALLIGQPQLAKAKSALATLTWLAPIPIPTSHSRVLAVATSSSEAGFRPVDGST